MGSMDASTTLWLSYKKGKTMVYILIWMQLFTGQSVAHYQKKEGDEVSNKSTTKGTKGKS